MRLSISEILKRTSELPTIEEKIDFLRTNQSVPLCSILKNIYDAEIKFILPEGAPPYKPNPYPGQELRLYSENRRLYIFMEGQGPNLSKVRREQLFIEMLEAVDTEDAKLLIAMKDKQMPYTGITGELVMQAFPGLIVSLNKEYHEAPERSIGPQRTDQPATPTATEAKSAPRPGRGARARKGKQESANDSDDANGGSSSTEQQSPAA